MVELETLITEVLYAPTAVVIPPRYKLIFTVPSTLTDFAKVLLKTKPSTEYVEIVLKMLLSNT